MRKANWKTKLWLKQQEIMDWKIRQILHNCRELRKQGTSWKDILSYL